MTIQDVAYIFNTLVTGDGPKKKVQSTKFDHISVDLNGNHLRVSTSEEDVFSSDHYECLADVITVAKCIASGRDSVTESELKAARNQSLALVGEYE